MSRAHGQFRRAATEPDRADLFHDDGRKAAELENPSSETEPFRLWELASTGKELGRGGWEELGKGEKHVYLSENSAERGRRRFRAFDFCGHVLAGPTCICNARTGRNLRTSEGYARLRAGAAPSREAWRYRPQSRGYDPAGLPQDCSQSRCGRGGTCRCRWSIRWLDRPRLAFPVGSNRAVYPRHVWRTCCPVRPLESREGRRLAAAA